MDFSQLKAVQFDKKQEKDINEQLQKQTTKVKVPFSNDGELEPWRVMPNDRALIYIPSFTMKDADGKRVVRHERALIHNIHGRNSYVQFRATANLTGLQDQGISGDDPLEEVVGENWEIYNHKLQVASDKINADPKSDTMQDTRSQLLNDFSVQTANESMFIPIVYIETEKDSKGLHSLKKVVKDENGMPKTHVYLFRIGVNNFKKKFGNIEATLDEDETIGGHFYSFSYLTGKETNEMKHPARDAGQAFVVSIMNLKTDDEDKLKQYLDSKAEKFTPEYLRQHVYPLMLLPDSVHKEIAKEAHDRIAPDLYAVRHAEEDVETEKTGESDTEKHKGESATEEKMRKLGAKTSELETKAGTGLDFSEEK